MSLPAQAPLPRRRGLAKAAARALFAVALTGPLLACDAGSDDPAPAAAPRPVKTLTLAREAAADTRSFPGVTAAVESATLAFTVPGTVLDLPVEVGSTLAEGELLARLDPRDFENRVAQATAERDRTRAQYQRVARAAETGAVSKQALSDARAAFDAAQSQLNIAQKALDDTELRAPFAGEVVATFTEAYENIQPTQPIVRLVDRSRLEMTVDVPERLRLSLDRVSASWVRLDAYPDAAVPAEITEVGSEPSATTRTYPVTLTFAPPAERLVLPGQAGRAGFTLRRADRGDLFTLPTAALVQTDSGTAVWTLRAEADGTATVTRVAVTVEARTPLAARGARVRGLGPGDRVVIAGAQSLSEGQRVRPLPEAAQPGEAMP
ncbi:RND family efflux transporter MFP subunit [Rhodothalassium salexigens DSM 2132]|uniref:RND family efflux transporter MFP subunit n=1 Tax=Rhodothalassium salexigens DSM 2132 TaxID=1188247 RepID=A0A4R2PRP9_RHOSA|nr:efflux RND transporter periplasmic adaptor subunit [Rhodothalassium salexigens]MBB4210355.1 RND family efflux transporter MFP subunit [Rhodothalassium salexigens DSM 2132]MBK1638896.1 hypothetical protein [Rhodothalassium salexigens DSM 2132]TCP38519.1 RND family efflux transporter MFP subunit [Rhodothalassium salexigens DSM 2132]